MLNKNRIYTDQQKDFLNAMRDPDNAGDVRTCMTLAGYAKTTPMGSVTGPLAEELVAVAKDLMATHSVKATLSIVGVLNDPSMLGAGNVINAAKQILDRANVQTETKEIKVGIGEGIVILPAKGGSVE